MASRADIMAGKSFVTLYVKNSPLMQGLQAAGKAMVQFGGHIQQIGKWMTVLGTSIVSAMVAAAHHFATAGDTIAKMSQRTGVGTNALSELGYAAEQSGSHLEDLEGGITKLQRVMADAAAGSDSAKEKLLAMGTSFEALEGLSADEQLELIADGLRSIEDPGKRADAIMDVMGKSATKLLPLFADGAKGIRALRDEARELGLSINPEDAAAAVELGDAWDRVKKVIGAAVFAIGGALAPTLTSVLGTIKTFAVGVQRWIVDNQELVRTVAKVGVALTVAGAVIGGIGTVMVGVGSAIPIVVGAFTTLVTTVGAVTGAMGSMFAIATSAPVLVVGALAAAAAWLVFTDSGREAVGMVRDAFTKLPGIISGVVGRITDAVRSFGTMIGETVSSGVNIAVAAFSSMRARVATFIAEVATRISAGVSNALNALQARLSGVSSSVGSAFGSIRARVGSALAGLGGLIRTAFDSAVQIGIARLGMLVTFAKSIAGAIATHLSIIGSAAGRMWSVIKAGHISAAQNIRDAFSSIASWLSGVWSKITDTFAAAFERIKEIVGVTVTAIRDAFAGGDLALAGSIAITGLKLAFVEGLSGLSTMIGGVIGDTIGTITSQIVGGDFTGAWATAVKAMGAVWAAWAEGVVKTFTSAAMTVITTWKKTVAAISDEILRLAADEGITGQVFSKIVGVDVNAAVRKNIQLEQERVPRMLKERQEAKAGTTAKLAVAIDTGDLAAAENLHNHLLTIERDIARLKGLPPPDLLGDAGADVRRQLDIATAGIDAAISAMNADAERGTQAAADALTTATAGGSQALKDLADQTRDELDRLSALAKQKGDDARAKAAVGKKPLEPPKPPDLDDMKKRSEVTFSAAALINLGQGGGPQERIAKAVTEQTREVKSLNENGKKQLAALKSLKFQYG